MRNNHGCLNNNCALQYVASQDRLYVSENGRMRYITDPENPANHTMTTLFSVGSNIHNFILSPDNKYIFYTRSNALFCHAINLADESAICKNNPANHINLGPPPSLTQISKGGNQLTWKNSTTLFVNTYTGEIYEYKVQH